MMSNRTYKLHPISAIINFLKGLKELIIPIGIIFISSTFNSQQTNEINFWSDIFPILIITVPVFFYLIFGIIKWWTFVYWFEDDELRSEYGLFVKKKRYIPFERIQSLNYKEGIFHQIFGLVQVMVETAGSTNGKPEVELTAVTKEAAKQIEIEMENAKRKARIKLNEEDSLIFESSSDSEISSKLIHKMSSKDLLLLATTSNSIGVVLAGIVALLSQFSEYIPLDLIFEEVSAFIQFGFLVILGMIFIGLVFAWIASVGLTFLSYYDFKIVEENDRIIVTRGLLEKKKIAIPVKRIQAIKIVENPIRQLFGLASVSIESAGGGYGEKEKKIILFPLIRKKELYPLLGELFPQFDLGLNLTKPPSKAKSFFYRIDFIWVLPLVALLSYFYYPYGLLSILLVVPVVLLGLWQYRTAGYAILNNQLTLVYRIFSRVTFLTEKKRIQVIGRRQSYFQKRNELASIQATVMSGVMGATAKVAHLKIEDADKVFKWFQSK